MLNLVLLPGWGISADCLQPLAEALQQRFPKAQLQILPLPRFTQPNLAHALTELQEQLPSTPWLIGWSLGGMLALQLTQQLPVAGVITIASNACFTQRPDWPWAMAQEDFAAFQQGCAAQLTSILKRFSLLCSQGADNPRQLAKQLLPFKQTPEQASHGLSLLQQLDNRQLLAQLAVPQLHILAQQDALVPLACSSALQQLASQAHIATFNGSHALVMEQPAALATRMAHFIREADDAE